MPELPSPDFLSKSTLYRAINIRSTAGTEIHILSHESMNITTGIKRYPNATVSNTDAGFLFFSMNQL